MNTKVYQLLKITIFNLFIVSLLGVLMRYKIAFYLPLVDQKHLQEAHSHFAFYGWVTSAIYFFIFLQKIGVFFQDVLSALTWCSSASSAVNPIIYAFFNFHRLILSEIICKLVFAIKKTFTIS